MLAALVVFAMTMALWGIALRRVMRARPARSVERELLRVFADLLRLLDACAESTELGADERVWAKRARRYAAWPIDLWPFGRVDDLVIALGALRRVSASKGVDWLATRWSGDEVGWNAVRRGLGLPDRWEP
ncbi:MAG: hypothetical protein AB7S26_27855 [Sandaracinaceae bacterium]